MPIKINGTNTAANPSITGDDTDTGIVYGSDQIDFSTGGSSKVTLNGSNLGIGIQSPQEILHVKGASETISSRDCVIFGSTDSLAADKGLPLVWTAHIGTDANYGIASICGRKENATNDNGAGYLQFGTGNDGGAISERMRITSAGKLLVGSSADLFSNNKAEFVNSSADATVGIRSETGVVDQEFIAFKFGGGPTSCGGIRRDGSTQGPEFFSGSDRRIKTNILDMDNTLAKINQLSLKKFDYKDGTGSGIGVIAQDLISIFPSKVKKDDSDDGTGDTVPDGVKPWTVGTNFTWQLLKAIQELSAKVETLETKVAALEAK